MLKAKGRLRDAVRMQGTGDGRAVELGNEIRGLSRSAQTGSNWPQWQWHKWLSSPTVPKAAGLQLRRRLVAVEVEVEVFVLPRAYLIEQSKQADNCSERGLEGIEPRE